jgi:tape measure domain-containing protein
MARDLVVQLKLAADKFQQGINESNRSLQTIQGSVSNVDRAFQRLQTVMLGFIGVTAFKRLAVDIVETGMAMQRMTTAMSAATGSTKAGAESMDFLRRTSERLGLEFQGVVGAYAQLAAASRQTSLEGKKTQEIFLAITEAATALQLSSQQVNLSIYALQQMLSKGKVASEELRRQLGDVMPGAFQIAARAMGVTTQQLDKMMSEGRLLSEDFLPKFAAQIRKEFGGSIAEASQTAQANLNRLKNAWLDVKMAINDMGFLNLASEAFGNLSWAITYTIQKLGEFKKNFQENAKLFYQGIQPGTPTGPQRYPIGPYPNYEQLASEGARNQWRYNVAVPMTAQQQADVAKIAQDTLYAVREEINAVDEADAKYQKWIKAQFDAQQKLGQAQIESLGDLEAAEGASTAQGEILAQRNRDRAYEKQVKDQQDALDRMQKQYDNFTRYIYNNTADAFYDIFTGTINSWNDLLERMKNLFFRWVAGIAAQEVVINVLPQFLTAMGSLGLGSFSATAASGANALSGAGNIGNLASLSSLGGLTSWTINNPFASPGSQAFGPGTAVYNNPALSIGSAFVAGALGSFGYSTVGNWIGLPQSNYSGITSGLGAGLGFLAGGPIGAVAGALGGGFLWGLFGGGGEHQFTLSELDTLYKTKWVPGAGLTAAKVPTAWGENDWYVPIADAYVKARNSIIDSVNQQIKAMLSIFPEDYSKRLEAQIAKINWSFPQAGTWNVSAAQGALDLAISQLQKAYGKAVNSIFSQLGLDVDKINQYVQMSQLRTTLSSTLTPMWENFVMGLQTSNLAPVQSLEAFTKFYRNLEEEARTGDQASAQALMQYVSGQYLPFVQSYTSGGEGYQSIFNQIISQQGDVYQSVFSTLNEVNKQFDELFDYVKQLLDRPININVQIDGRTVAKAVASQLVSGHIDTGTGAAKYTSQNVVSFSPA